MKRRKTITVKKRPLDITTLLKKSREPTPVVMLLASLCALLLGLYLQSRELSRIATDFFERLPEERVAALSSAEPEYRPVKKEAERAPKMSGGGGDPRARVTHKGVLGIIDGQIKAKSIASADVFGKAGLATDIDAILKGSADVESIKEYRRGSAGIGYGSGASTGFGSIGQAGKKSSVHYTPNEYKQKRPQFSENAFQKTETFPKSTFSIDVDNASYTRLLEYLKNGMLPPPDMIRIEELINNFTYNYPVPSGKHPISITSETGPCPWNQENVLIRIGVRGRSLPPSGPPPANFVFLVDISGSMSKSSRLELFKKGLKHFAGSLKSQDRISIITYAGETGIHLNTTSGDQREKIASSIDQLTAAGSTAGGEGIHLAYRMANRTFIPDGNNRVIIVTDGNFNVGPSSKEDLIRLIGEKKGNGIFLTVLGLDVDEDKESAMEQLADNGDGNYALVYNEADLKQTLGKLNESFFTVAKDVKIQVTFKPEFVESYRLIGYENRMLATEDFENDKKDAGEIGAEQTVTALYEIVPFERLTSSSDPDFMTIDVRYKNGTDPNSKLINHHVKMVNTILGGTSDDFRFAASVAGLGMILCDSQYKGDITYSTTRNLATSAVHGGDYEQRFEFINVIDQCERIATGKRLLVAD